MDQQSRRRLERLIEREARDAAAKLLKGKSASTHLDRIEMAQKTIAASSSFLQPGWRLVVVAASFCLVIVATMAGLHVENTSAHVEALAESVRIETNEAFRWRAEDTTRLLLKSMSGLSLAKFPDQSREDESCGLEVENTENEDIRLVEMSLDGEPTLTLFGDGRNEVDIVMEASVSSLFSVEADDSKLTVKSGGTSESQVVQNDFFRLESRCKFAMLTLKALPNRSVQVDFGRIQAHRIEFVRRLVNSHGAESFRSSLKSAAVRYRSTDSTPVPIGEGETLALVQPRGTVTVTGDPRGLRLTFEGEVLRVTRGESGRSMNPSVLFYLKHNTEALLLFSAVAAIWALLWGARSLLVRQ